MDSLKTQIADFEEDNHIGAIFFHHEGKDKFLVFNFKFHHNIFVELSAKGVKEITLPIIEEIINGKRKRPGDVVVWLSYFENDTLKRLTDQEYFETPAEFKSTFDLVRGDPITSLRYHNAVIFDFRRTNSKKEFVYLPDGSRVHFGKSYDVYQRHNELDGYKKYFEGSIRLFGLGDVNDALAKVNEVCKKIFELTDDSKDLDFVDDAQHVISRYFRIHNSDVNVELRNLLGFRNLDELKEERDYALKCKKNLFALLEELRELSEHRELSIALDNHADFPSL